MTHEQRLDRLERIARLFVKAGLRARAEMREQDEKINIILKTQIGNNERFAEHDEKIKMLIDLHVENEGRFVRLAESQASLAESQADTDRRLNSLIDIVRQGRNGGSLPPLEAT